MTRKWTATGLDFEALRHAIEHRDPDAMLGFYAEASQLNIVNASTPHAPPFELHGKAEIAKHLRVVFGQKTSHRVTRQIFSGDRVTFLEACDYQDGDRVWVETTLEVRGGRIVRQVDLVTWGARPDGQDGAGRGPPGRLRPEGLARARAGSGDNKDIDTAQRGDTGETRVAVELEKLAQEGAGTRNARLVSQGGMRLRLQCSKAPASRQTLASTTATLAAEGSVRARKCSCPFGRLSRERSLQPDTEHDRLS